MFRRDLLSQLKDWKEREHSKPLVLRGARQVGKTTLIKQFGKEFQNFIYLNLERGDALLFDQFSEVNELWQFLCLKHHITNTPNSNVLLFIDEIQERPSAVAMLRYFYEELPWLHVVAAGSRLQSLLKERVSFPVGRVEYMDLRPFSFVEYLEASEGTAWAEMIRNITVPESFHTEMLHAFNIYALIGGMPEAVSTYIETHDLQKLSPIYKSLLKGYNEDADKFAKNKVQVRILRHLLASCWGSAAEAITFDKFGNSSYTSQQVHDGLDLLQRAYLLTLDYPVTSTAMPPMPVLRRAPKLIMVDNGLTNFFAGIQLEYLQNKELNDTWRGRSAEHIVAQELRTVLDRNNQEHQHFWIRDKKGSTAEVDFILPYRSHIVPIEVKSGLNSHLRSIHAFVSNSEQRVTAVRFWSGPFSIHDIATPPPDSKPFRLLNVPFYYAGHIDKILDKYMQDTSYSL